MQRECYYIFDGSGDYMRNIRRQQSFNRYAAVIIFLMAIHGFMTAAEVRRLRDKIKKQSKEIDELKENKECNA